MFEKPFEKPFEIYSDKGTTLAERGAELPPVELIPGMSDPRFYLPDAGLCDAVNVALLLGKPLLVTGEPGTGKTELAKSLAYQVGKPLHIFNTKTTSTARDLFYRYDALGHFHDAHITNATANTKPEVETYITYEALGLAILLSLPAEESQALLPGKWRGQGQNSDRLAVAQHWADCLAPSRGTTPARPRWPAADSNA